MVAGPKKDRVHCTGPHLAASPDKTDCWTPYACGRFARAKPRRVAAGLPMQQYARLLGRFVLVFRRVSASLVFRALVLRGLGILFGRRFLLGGLFLRHSGLFRFFGFFGLCFLFGRLGICGLLVLLFLCLLLFCFAFVCLAYCCWCVRC